MADLDFDDHIMPLIRAARQNAKDAEHHLEVAQATLPGMGRTTPRTAEEKRDDAIERVRKGAGGWTERALRAVEFTASKMEHFTTDDCRMYAVEMAVGEPREPRAWGAVMKLAAGKGGCCVKTGEYRKSRRPECHARPIPVYESLTWKGAA